jgi:ABC-type polysaccharide/polyol phosphate transport system ATPase subunit
MEQSVVKTEGLLKEYHIYDRPSERLKELLLKTKKHRVFRALGPLDITVPRGETLGIVGENGSGKSTFLKIVAGVIEPSSGTMTVHGKVSSILELGTGFNPEFTGRENVVLNGALLGLSSPQINKRMDTIKHFADIGEFFDMPVKMYSSGMYMRLAFSLAVHVDTDIIVIDEALAVGDGLYEKKCIDRIWELKRNGITLLFCSHSLYTVANFCDRVLWLREGRTEGLGETKAVLSRYEDYLREKQGIGQPGTPFEQNAGEKKLAKVCGIELVSEARQEVTSLPYGSTCEVILDFEVFDNTSVSVGFAVDRNDGLCCYADSMVKQGMEPYRGPGTFRASVRFREFPLLGGAYKVIFFLLDETGICVFDKGESPLFNIDTLEKEWGVCYMQHEWKR